MSISLPIHAVTGESAVGFRRDGRPIWAIKGGSGEGDGQPGANDQGDADKAAADKAAADKVAADKKAQDDADAALGDAGKKAIKAEREARQAADKKATELEAENARLRRSNAATKGTDLEAIKTELSAEFEVRMVTTEIKAEAKGRLRDASDALLYIDAKTLKAGDEKAITAAIDKLLTDRPYLAAEPGTQWGDVGGGPRDTPKDAEPASPQARMARAYGRKSS